MPTSTKIAEFEVVEAMRVCLDESLDTVNVAALCLSTIPDGIDFLALMIAYVKQGKNDGFCCLATKNV